MELSENAQLILQALLNETHYKDKKKDCPMDDKKMYKDKDKKKDYPMDDKKMYKDKKKGY